MNKNIIEESIISVCKFKKIRLRYNALVKLTISIVQETT